MAFNHILQTISILRYPPRQIWCIFDKNKNKHIFTQNSSNFVYIVIFIWWISFLRYWHLNMLIINFIINSMSKAFLGFSCSHLVTEWWFNFILILHQTTKKCWFGKFDIWNCQEEIENFRCFVITFIFCGNQNQGFEASSFAKPTIVDYHQYELHAKFRLKMFYLSGVKCDFVKPYWAERPNLASKRRKFRDKSHRIDLIWEFEVARVRCHHFESVSAV